MAAEPISQRGLALARRRASAGDAVRLEGQSSFRSVPYLEQRADRCRFPRDIGGLARALRGPTQGRARNHWALRLRAPPAIRRLHSRDVRLPVAVADIADAGDVPRVAVDVRPVGA